MKSSDLLSELWILTWMVLLFIMIRILGVLHVYTPNTDSYRDGGGGTFPFPFTFCLLLIVVVVGFFI